MARSVFGGLDPYVQTDWSVARLACEALAAAGTRGTHSLVLAFGRRVRAEIKIAYEPTSVP